MIRTYKYRLYPTKKQFHLLDELLFQMQAVYNDALNERRWYWQRSRRSITYYDQWARLRDLRHESPDEMGMLNATSMQQMLRRVDKAYKAFYKGQRGHPRFKGRNRFKSVEYRHRDGCRLRDDSLYVQNVGQVKVKLHRDIADGATITQVVIKRDAGKWYACLMLEMPDIAIPVHTGPTVGIDVGISSLLALSDGTLINNPRWSKRALAKGRRLNRKLARQKRYGSGWRKTVQQIARNEEHIANQRRDFWHKTTRTLVNTHSAIAVENLPLAFMTRNGSLAQAAHDAGLGIFFDLLGYKAEETGSKVIKVDPKHTSQMCSGCGQIVAKGLSVRVHRCDCGLVIDRDVNAARNIHALGLSVEALTWPVAACVVSEAHPL